MVSGSNSGCCFWKINGVLQHAGSYDCFRRLRGGPRNGHCAEARERYASATKWGCDTTIDFHPEVSNTSEAWLGEMRRDGLPKEWVKDGLNSLLESLILRVCCKGCQCKKHSDRTLNMHENLLVRRCAYSWPGCSHHNSGNQDPEPRSLSHCQRSYIHCPC